MNVKDVIHNRPPEQVSANSSHERDTLRATAGLARVGEDQTNGRNDVERREMSKPAGKPQRALAMLGRGRSVVVIGRGLTLDSWIKTLQEAINKARRAKTYGLQLDSFLKMLRDVAQ